LNPIKEIIHRHIQAQTNLPVIFYKGSRRNSSPFYNYYEDFVNNSPRKISNERYFYVAPTDALFLTSDYYNKCQQPPQNAFTTSRD
jgi:hypothetical protein